MPNKATDFHGEVACYSLPYGGLGFASHFLTYYTLLCLWNGRSPLWPKRRVRYSKIDLWLGGISLIVTTGLAILTLVRCRNSWQLLTVAVWKMSMSLLNGITAVNVASIVLKARKVHGDYWVDEELQDKRKKLERLRSEVEQEEAARSEYGGSMRSKNSSATLGRDLPGMFAGMAGLMSLVSQHLHDRRLVILTAVFYSIVGLGICISLIFACSSSGFEAFLWGLLCSTVVFTILAAFYSDWALGIMTNNLVGLPSGDNSGIFWSYWVAKRLTMFSW
ncbi:hypothetical protein BDN72DRAFT_885711 [Pluteus cervinus]|uniref:Uncharacterized protein n=1 Tax=Pluteus cervinus TaxID=181527 RepID=A0ACD3BBJ0_9AGAR|nr:hypothetical protein BDN72DRAFT_885711 [Pluteus cervinus]